MSTARPLLILLLTFTLCGCASHNPPAKDVCQQHQAMVWEAARSYYLMQSMKPDDLVDPQKLIGYFGPGKVPCCPLGTNAYTPFKIFVGPTCPHEPRLHPGSAMPENIAKIRSNQSAEPETASPAPEGFEVVHLPGIDGSILKPKGWYFQHFGDPNSPNRYHYQMTKEDASKQGGFVIGFTITVAAGVSKVTQQKPSEYAAIILRDYPKIEIISKGEVRTFPTGQGSLEQRAWIVDQEVPVGGTNTVCRVGITTAAVDQIDFLVVIVFGTPREEWIASQSIYETVCQKIRILGPNPGK